jgi:REP element-mobilizing transposase RayT
VELAGGVYHVIARGNERRDIFRDDSDRRLYLARLAECQDRYEFGVLAFCLMPNHVHLAIERGPVALSKIILALHFYYSQKFNFRHERVGHLFQGRYRAYLVEHDRYLAALIRYIHLNPVKAGIVDRPEAYPWSSDRWYRERSGPSWLDVDRFLSLLAPTRTRASAAYRRCMGSREAESYDEVAALGRVVKGDEEFADRSMRMARLPMRSPSRWTAGSLARVACRLQGFSFERLKGPYRGRPESRARLITAYIGVRDHAVSTAAMARCFGRDESAFAHGLRRLEDAMARDAALRRMVERIASTLRTDESEMQVRPQESEIQG